MAANPPTIPTAADLAEQGEMIPPGDAFVLLSKPTLELSFADIKAIANDLRAKRVRFLQGKADKPAKAALPKPTPEEKEARQEYVKGLLGQGALKI